MKYNLNDRGQIVLVPLINKLYIVVGNSCHEYSCLSEILYVGKDWHKVNKTIKKHRRLDVYDTFSINIWNNGRCTSSTIYKK